MKKLLGIIVLGLLWCNTLSAKIIKLGSSNLEFPNRFFAHEWNKDMISDFCNYYGSALTCSIIVDKKNQNSFNDYNSGVPLEDIRVLKPILRKLEKLENSTNLENSYKSLIKFFERILKKQSLDLVFEYIEIENAIETFNSWNLDFDYDEIKSMNNSELAEISTELEEEIISNFSESSMLFNISNFKIAKNINQEIFIKIYGDMKFIILDGLDPIKINYNLYLTEYNNNIIHFAGVCMVNCSKLKSTFNNIINESFNDKIRSSNLNERSLVETDIVNKIKQLNELYKSGALTKEEFTKAKKKLLN